MFRELNRSVVQGFESAWEKACEMDGGTVAVPAGSYRVSGATFSGQCRSKWIPIQLVWTVSQVDVGGPRHNLGEQQQESSISIENVKFIDIHGSSITPFYYYYIYKIYILYLIMS